MGLVEGNSPGQRQKLPGSLSDRRSKGSSLFQICYTKPRGSFLSPGIVWPCSYSKTFQGSLLLGLALTSHPGSLLVTHQHLPQPLFPAAGSH